MNWVGRRLPRYEDPVLLRGDGRFVADLARGALAMRFVRSPVARGTIRDITVPPGARVITAADLAEVKPLCPRLLRPDFVPIAQPVLATGRVTYVGEPIAAVIADSAAAAEDIAEEVLKRANEGFLDLIGRVRPGVNPHVLEAKLKVELHDWLASHVPDMEPFEK